MRRALRMPIAIPGAIVAIIGTVVVVMGAGSVVTAVVPVVTPPVTAPEMEMKKNLLKSIIVNLPAVPPPVLITPWRRSGAKVATSGAILPTSGAREVTKLRALEMSSNRGEQ